MNLAELEFSEHGGSVAVTVRGELDRSNTISVQDAITSSIPNTSHGLVLDLTGVTYLDSSGIRMIYQLRDRLDARGQELVLVIPPAAPAGHTLRLAGVSGHITTVADLTEIEPSGT